MGILSRLFGKKEKEPDLPGMEGLGHEEGAPERWGMPELGPTPKPPARPEQAYEEPSIAPPMQERTAAPAPSYQGSSGPQLELINSKLDAIRAVLQSLEMRLANLEKIAQGGEEKEHRRYY